MPYKDRCRHPRDQREKVKPYRDGKVRCGSCGAVFVPRGTSIYHGTYRGYAKHRRDASTHWPWPAGEGTCGCHEAGQQFRRDVAARPEARRKKSVRSAARQRAFRRLSRAFPGQYAAYYAQEVAESDTAQLYARVPLWDDLMSRLVKIALDRDEATVRERVRAQMASPNERELIRLADRLRVLMESRGCAGGR